jgi:hypothetical protein
MAKFKVILARDVTESLTLIVDAPSMESAEEEALSIASESNEEETKWHWDGVVGKAYLPCPGEAEEVENEDLKEVKEAIEKFYKLQTLHKDCGALDSEPYRRFHRVIRQVLNGEEVYVPNSRLGWQLYNSEGSFAAVIALTKATREVIKLINNCRLPEIIALKKQFN